MTAPTVDWAGWLRRWEAQQGRMRHRETRFGVIVDAVRTSCGDAPRVLDLGCGPGSLAVRIVEALPGARVVAVDMDPVLLELGRRAHADEERVTFVDADLGGPDLVGLGGGFDAAVSTTALHWLRLDPLRALYRSLSVMLRPGGIFLDGDRLQGSGSPLIDDLLHRMRRADADSPVPGSETWEEWWEAIAAEPGLAAEVAERRRRRHDHPDAESTPTLLDHHRALRDAGFADVGILWQLGDDRVLAAVR